MAPYETFGGSDAGFVSAWMGTDAGQEGVRGSPCFKVKSVIFVFLLLLYVCTL